MRLLFSTWKLLAQKKAEPHLQGWAGVEDDMMTHDEDRMEDYADDIDVLLVFVSKSTHHDTHRVTELARFHY